jgi:hypothetical protein
MERKIEKMALGLLIATLFVMPLSVVGITLTNNEIPSFKESTATTTAYINSGWLEERDGVKILHLNGSYYDMGYQHGYLLRDEIGEALRAQLTYFENKSYPYERLVEVWNVMDDYLPNEYKEEMQGMADGAGMSFEDIAVINVMPVVLNIAIGGTCCELSLWGDATADGKLIHVRSFDWKLNLKDPETGTLLQENIVILIRNPENGYASIIPEFAGAVSAWHGINEKGIAVGEVSCMTSDTTLHGISQCFRMRMMLDRCDTAEQATSILTSNRTIGTVFVLSDANVPIGYVFEQTTNNSYVGTWDDPVEGIDPFWQIKDVLRRTWIYVNPECADVEIGRIRYDPSGLIGVWYALIGKSNMIFPWTHYRALSQQIEKYYGTLDVNSTMTALREEYSGKTNFLWYLATHLYGIGSCLYQWVVCPETGEMAISITRSDTWACYEPVHYFNIYELMEAKP